MTNLAALWAFLVAAAAALVLTPLASRLAHRVGAVDEPGERSLHEQAKPRLGGLAILAAVVISAALFLPGGEESRGILLGAAAIALIGTLDDLFELSPQVKLAGQFAAALIPVLFDVRVDNITLPFLGAIDFGSLGGPLTLIGIVAVINVVNFIDGVDGLAAGVCTIAAATFAVIALSLDRDYAAVLAALTAGASIGFLRHNFHPASIFMGDSGSNLLGFLLACVAIQGVLKTAAVVALVFPLVILAVPLLDSGFVIAKRIKHRRPVYAADRWHFHHRFANIGFSQRRTVLYLYGWTLALAALALALRFVPYSDDHGNFDTAWTLVMVGFGALAVAASAYLVFVLEILKFKRLRERQIRRAATRPGQAPPTAPEIEAEIAREVETGEFAAVGEPRLAGAGEERDGAPGEAGGRARATPTRQGGRNGPPVTQPEAAPGPGPHRADDGPADHRAGDEPAPGTGETSGRVGSEERSLESGPAGRPSPRRPLGRRHV